MRRLLNLQRLAIALVIVVPLIAATYYFLVPRETDPFVRIAVIVDTPDAGARKVGLQPGNVAPKFEVSTHDGWRVKLSDFRGRPVLINFWARWCTSCLSEMPEIKALQQERGADSFVVVAVNAGETRAQALEFIDFLDAPFTFALDPGLHLSDAYDVRGLPNSIFIDATGVVQAVYAGHADRARLSAYVDAAAKGQPPAPQPFALRPVSDIPRDNVLQVKRNGSDRLSLTSRAFRCDLTYCADRILETLKQAHGISEARLLTTRDGERALSLRYDASVLNEGQAVQAVIAALMALEDPVYTRASQSSATSRNRDSSRFVPHVAATFRACLKSSPVWLILAGAGRGEGCPSVP
jgi:peroxiredoxin